MGFLLRLNCKKCGYTGDFQIGAGMRDNDVETLINSFDGSVKEEAVRILGDPEESVQWDFDRALGQCTVCGKLQAAAVLIKGGQRIAGSCECGGPLRLWVSDETFDRQKDVLPVCPECKEVLIPEKAGLWD